MIYFDNASKQYDNGQLAIDQVTFNALPGELVFLTGHSGAGKSTILRLLALFERPTSGNIFVNGSNCDTVTKRKIPLYRRKIGLVFQDHQLLMHRSVFDNVSLPLLISGATDYEISRKVRAILDMLGLLKYENALPCHLSAGQQQRVGIARAMVTKPSILLADEPTGNLDPQLSNEILHLFAKFAMHGTCVIIASHDIALIKQFKSRVLTLQSGRLTQLTNEVINTEQKIHETA